MLRIVTGPFHPLLEQALAEDIRSLKLSDAYAPAAIIVPSSTVASWIKEFLAIQSGCPLLNVHVLTFHQLALRLRNDLVGAGRAIPNIQLVDDFYFEQLVRQVARRDIPGLAQLTRLPNTPGTWKGLWATVRDLKDAAVSPVLALRAVAEGLFDEEDRPWLEALFTLHASILEAGRSLNVGSPDDLAYLLTTELAESPFLHQLRALFYFGFYDLSQVQLSFFQSITAVSPATLYFPLESKPAYKFSQQFYDRHLLPLAPEHRAPVTEAQQEGRQHSVDLRVITVVGTDEELASICREILTLVEVNGYQFDEIGVVARSLEPYQHRLQAVFDRHLVPFTSTAGIPVMREPLAKALLRMASLPLNHFERFAVLDVLTSPWYRISRQQHPLQEPRPDLWHVIVSTFGITKGEKEWSRLAPSTRDSILQDAPHRVEDEQQVVDPQDCGQAAELWSRVSELIEDCRALPKQGTVNRLTDAYLELIKKHFVIPGWTDGKREEDTPVPGVGLLLIEALERLRTLDPLRSELSWEEWYELLTTLWEETALPIEGDQHRGVHVMDAMTARGLHFRALFLLGMNEQAFPRHVREDPFLRDRHRALMGSTLGYKIDEKLAGYDEERLLFALLSHAASDRLYLTYQRADEEGRAKIPSAFIAAALLDERFVSPPEFAVPRRLTARISSQPALQEIMPLQDLALCYLLQGQDPKAFLELVDKDIRLFSQGLSVQMLQERESPELGPFDGVLPHAGTAHHLGRQQRYSPTALECYATCPFRYFAEKVLRMEPIRRRQDMQLPAMTIGTLLHEALRLSYERLLSLRWPDPSVTELEVRTVATEVANQVFSAHAATRNTGHALLWTMAREQVVVLVIAMAASDQKNMLSRGFHPHAFEVDAEGVFDLGEGMPPLQIHGTIDRIDVQNDHSTVRVVDYKFKQGSEMKSEDRNLRLSAVRGLRLQPPLYASMTMPSLPNPSEVELIFLAPRWEDVVARSTFERVALEGKSGAAIAGTLRTLVRGIQEGQFFILPDSYCEQCEFSSACRRNDQSTWWRSYRAPQARLLRRIRKQKVSDD